jgi:hypothetical protein
MEIKGKGAMETFDIAVEAAAYFFISPTFQACDYAVLVWDAGNNKHTYHLKIQHQDLLIFMFLSPCDHDIVAGDFCC